MSASWALQQAIFATLVSSDEVKEVLGDPPRVFDAPPRAAEFPYCVIGDDRVADWSTATEAGSEHAVALHLWSRAPGHKEAKLAAEVLREALDGAELSVTGQALVGIRHVSTDFTQDGESVHAVLKFRAILEPE